MYEVSFKDISGHIIGKISVLAATPMKAMELAFLGYCRPNGLDEIVYDMNYRPLAMDTFEGRGSRSSN